MTEQIIMMGQEPPSQLIAITHQFNEYNLYLNGPIIDPNAYFEHYAVYKQASQNDVIRLWLNSEGGDIAICETYIQHIQECEAPVIGLVGVNVASACSAIALSCDEIEVNDMSTLLVHSFQYQAGGTENKVYNQANFNKKLNERWLRKHFEGFLTEEQMEDALKGVDILFDADEIVEAWDNLQDYRKSLLEDVESLQDEGEDISIE